MDQFLKNKIAIITGGNQGFGLDVAKEYLKAGASVALCARNEQLLSKVSEDLRFLISPDQKILAITADVSKENDVRNFVDKTINEFGHIDILVNNAGVYGPKGSIEEVDWLSWVHAIEINLFGSILMCRAVLPFFKKQGYGKIIQLSGGGATNPMPKISAYAVSKAAIVRFVETLAEEVLEFKIDVNAIAPGALNTRLLDEVLAAGPEKVGQLFYEKSIKQKESGGVSFDHGTALAIFLASDLSNGITGKLISAVWDKWENWPNHIDELQTSDVYTLRRIVGKDRNLNWGDK
ncbi:MAG: SDR family oxidoreductase [Bacteroidales bacterium]|nr:SDR family oxidoreductase [Bacteroidales bacterium]